MAMKDTWRHEVYEIRYMNFVDLEKGCVMCTLIDSNCLEIFHKRARNDPLQVHGPFKGDVTLHGSCLHLVSVQVLRDTDQSYTPLFGSGGPWCEDKVISKTT